MNKEEVKEKNSSFKYYVLILISILGVLALIMVNYYIETIKYIGLTPQEREQIELKKVAEDKKRQEDWENSIKGLFQPIQVPAFILYAMGFIIVYFFFVSVVNKRRFI